jgi:hypothetical protein
VGVVWVVCLWARRQTEGIVKPEKGAGQVTKGILVRTLRLARGTSMALGVAVMLAVVLGVATTALGATGGNFILGKANSATTMSKLAASIARPTLQLVNKSTETAATALNLSVASGKAPLKVNASAGTATNLSADKLDGKDSSEFASYTRTVIVSPTGTPSENGTALKNALSGITDASETNPYLLKIEPGVYDLGAAPGLVMKPWVDVEGSGEGVTTLTATGGVPWTDATVQGASNAELRFLTVKNTGGLTKLSPSTAQLTPSDRRT